jgi:hypothetical protein
LSLDGKTQCRCCGANATFLFTGALIGHEVAYYECPVCSYVQTQDPHGLEQAYSNAINDSDTGIMARNQSNSQIVLSTLLTLGSLRDAMVDSAGGYGILVRMMRDHGVDAYWLDRYCQNLLAKGFEHQGQSASLVTAFESFEHYVNPLEELDKLLAIAPNVLLSTELIATPTPAQKDWWYYGPEHGQHIGFFRLRTLQRLAQKRGKHLCSNGTSYHLITDRPVNQSFWLAMMRTNRLMPLLVRRLIKSRIWPDFLAMSKADQ